MRSFGYPIELLTTLINLRNQCPIISQFVPCTPCSSYPRCITHLSNSSCLCTLCSSYLKCITHLSHSSCLCTPCPLPGGVLPTCLTVRACVPRAITAAGIAHQLVSTNSTVLAWRAGTLIYFWFRHNIKIYNKNIVVPLLG